LRLTKDARGAPRLPWRWARGAASAASRNADDAGIAHQAQVGAGDLFQIAQIAGQVARGPALRNHQRERLLVGGAALGQRCSLVAQQAVGLVEVAAVPGPHAVAHADHFAIAGARSQRHGVEVIEHQLAAHRAGVLAAEVGAQRGGGHLPQLFLARDGASVGRVAVLLDLRGQRAAAGRLVIRIEFVHHLVDRRLCEAIPLDRRVLGRMFVGQQFAILDEQQAVHQQARHLLEIRIHPFGIAHAKQVAAGAVEYRQAGLGLLAIGQEEAEIGDFGHPRCDPRLRGDTEAAAGQPLLQRVDRGIAQPFVERTVLRKADRVADALAEPVLHVLRQIGEQARLDRRGVDFVPGDCGADDDGQHRHEPQADLDPAPVGAPAPSRGGSGVGHASRAIV
jgi:hypothetical protein